MSTKVSRENKMGVMPVGRLLVSTSTPMMFSMLFQALYNIVDSVFVAMINEEALTAVSMAFPIQTLMIAFSVGTSLGVSALVSRSLGQKDFERANHIASNGILLCIGTALVFAVLTSIIAKPFYVFQTQDKVIIDYGVTYIRIVGLLCIGLFCQQNFERLLMSTGKTIFSMTSQIMGAVTNMIMDPILIFGLGPFPKMGVAGAAAATIFGQILGSTVGIICNLRFNKEIKINFFKYRLNTEIIKSIYSLGLPSIMMQGIGSIMTFGFNKILVDFSSTAVAVFGVYFKLQSFAFMPIFGMNNGMIPIIAYNYGAKKPDRIKKTVKLAMIAAVSFMVFCMMIFQLFPDKLLMIFSASEKMIAIGVPALRIISLHFVIAGISIISIACFQAVGHGVAALIVSLVRQLIFLLPLAALFSLSGNLNMVWIAFPMAEIASITMCIFFMLRIFKTEIEPAYEN